MENTENKTQSFLVKAVHALTAETDYAISLPIFLGGSEDIHNNITESAIAYISYGSAREKGREKEATIFKNKFDELREKNFPDISFDEAGAYCTIYMQFNRRYLNRVVANLPDLSEYEDFINRVVVQLKDRNPVPTPIINPIIGKVNANQDKRDRMRRRHFSGPAQTADTFNVFLYNSFISLKIKRPSRIEFVNLINDIELKLRYFGERWVVNSVNLERAGISRLIVDFFLDHVTYHSVEGILSPHELTNYILANDIDFIALNLLQAGSPKGVHYNLTCLANNCNHSELVLIQPYDLYLVNEADMDEDQLDLMYNIRNNGLRISPDDLKKYQNRYKYKGEAIDTAVKLYSELGKEEGEQPYGQFTLGVPTLAEYFTTFDLIAEKYDPTFKKYAIDYPDAKTYRTKRAEFVGATRMGEYLHWIKNQISYADPNDTEQENQLEDRGDDQRGFDEGLLDIFSDDDEAYWNTFNAVMTKVPYMTHCFVGILNSECPKCGKSPEKEKTTEFTYQSGFTPIDAVSNFFDLTHMLIADMGAKQQLQEEITT